MTQHICYMGHTICNSVYAVFSVKRAGFATYHWMTLDWLLNLPEPELHLQNTPVDT